MLSFGRPLPLSGPPGPNTTQLSRPPKRLPRPRKNLFGHRRWIPGTVRSAGRWPAAPGRVLLWLRAGPDLAGLVNTVVARGEGGPPTGGLIRPTRGSRTEEGARRYRGMESHATHDRTDQAVRKEPSRTSCGRAGTAGRSRPPPTRTGQAPAGQVPRPSLTTTSAPYRARTNARAVRGSTTVAPSRAADGCAPGTGVTAPARHRTGSRPTDCHQGGLRAMPHLPSIGIIPAGTGSRTRRPGRCRCSRDHPRMRGEQNASCP